MLSRRIPMGMVESLGKMSVGTSLLMGAVLLCAVAAFDWSVAPQIGMSVFYLLPLAVVTQRNSRWIGLAMALACGATWLAIELHTNKVYSQTLVPFWNAIVRTSFFCLVSVLMSGIRVSRRHG